MFYKKITLPVSTFESPINQSNDEFYVVFTMILCELKLKQTLITLLFEVL